MLSVAHISLNNASYYENLAQKDDYYSAESESPGRWHGELANRLGLTGNIKSGQLTQFLGGYNPVDGKSLARNSNKKNRKAGWDFTFSAPKSVSLLWASSSDDERKAIEEAQEKSVKKALSFFEQHAVVTRYRNDPELSGGLAFALYDHSCSRDLDPQLHTHCLLANLNEKNGEYGAIDIDLKYKMAAGALYRVELADQLKQMGFGIERDKTCFRLSNISQENEKEFSNRSEEIKAQGYKSAKAKAIATLNTRKTKVGVNRKQLLDSWKGALNSKGISADLAKCETKIESPKPDQILNNLTEHKSVLRESDVMAKFFQENQGVCSSDECLKSYKDFLQSPELVKLRPGGIDYETRQKRIPLYSTIDMIKIEKNTIDRVKKDYNRPHQEIKPETVKKELKKKPTLTMEQKKAVLHITQDTGQIACIQGRAGTGKSFMLDTAREIFESNNLKVKGCAPTGKAAEGLQVGTRIKSDTIHSLLLKVKRGQEKIDKNTVIICDEAGMVDSRLMNKLTKLSHENNAKLILVGDTGQLPAVGAGGIFKQIQNEIGAKQLKEIRRQNNQSDRDNVNDFAEGRGFEVLQRLANTNQYSISKTKADAQKNLVSKWDPEKESLIIAQSNHDVDSLNSLAREKKFKGVNKKDINIKTQNHDKLNFCEQDVIIFEKNSKKIGVRNGTRGKINQISEQNGSYMINVTTDQGKKINFNTKDYTHFNHGYAVTAHKSQGVTVDNAFVLLDDMADKEWTYVAGSRHRKNLQIFTSEIANQDMQKRLKISHTKDTTLQYKNPKNNHDKGEGREKNTLNITGKEKTGLFSGLKLAISKLSKGGRE